MSLVRWFRKNKTKVMAIVVIVLMVGFIGGSYIQQLGQKRRSGKHDVLAYFGQKTKITRYDLALARQELETLKTIRADAMLRSQDLRVLLLSELLFPERMTSPELINRIKQIIESNGYKISSKQINDLYRRSVPPHIYWLLLKKEIEQVGIRLSKEDAGKVLGQVIPQLFDGASYSQVMSSFIERMGIPEEQILTTFGKILAVAEYAKMVCASEDITNAQIMHNISWEGETIDVEFVQFNSAIFAETAAEPDDKQINEHFNKYKEFLAGSISDQNPYGFGYKLADSIQFEYIAVKLDDISKIITPPTDQELEEYYQKNRDRFKVSIPSDPNDPNSPKIERTRSYAEVAGIISKQFLQQKINSRVEKLLREARTLTEAGFQNLDTEAANLSPEQLRELAGDYKAAAEQLSKQNNVKIYTGQTGLLDALDMQADEGLGRLYLREKGYNPVTLTQYVFAIEQLGASESGPFDPSKPRLYENIGPIKDIFGRVMMIVRVIKAQKASEPESIEQVISKEVLALEETEEQEPAEKTYSVKEKVVEDLKKLAAMEMTKSKAEEFIKLATKKDWDKAIKKFNKLYEPKDVQEPNSFELQKVENLRRISTIAKETLSAQQAGSPMEPFLANETQREIRLVDQLYSLVPADSNSIDTLPLVIEFKPGMSYYCLKNILVKRLEQQQYEKLKAMRAFREDFIRSQALAPVFFSPENIIKRMNFRLVEQQELVTEVNEPAEAKDE